MTVPQEILGLVGRFENNREAYRSGTYNETQLRREFVDPFFKILGWDVNNEKGYAEAYKDVIHEDSIKVGGLTKAPDYCFRVGGTRKFFVETKKPSVNLKDDISPAFQLRRYAWSAKLPLSILTDFEEFAVYDCRVKPDKSDKSSTARILYLNCNEYAQRWDEIFEIFSRDAVLKGSFDKYAESSKVKKGTASVDDAFLKEIESWRDMIARSLALRNADLNQHDLNFAVQRTIDRIVFLRICEDRGIEQYGRLMSLQNGDRVYARLCEMFHRADERYNSGLFHFQKDKSRAESPDTLTLNVTVDDSALKNIIKNLYYPDSPYEFSVISSDILGQVYEQFLGKVIRLTAGHRAVVEEKPEVRKAGGVYYTPTYIVDYIVKNTVGQLVKSEIKNPKSKIKDTTPKEISKIRILDPACGSGSFLLGAYQYLLDWHRDWYVADGPEKWATGRSPALYQIADSNPQSLAGSGLQPEPNISVQSGTIEPAEKSPPGRGLGGGYKTPKLVLDSDRGSKTGNWHLTTAERKRILLNNIYGVDIDPQAVEVTKLSLLLKVLEGESEQTLARQFKLFHERALPDLGNNIKCGNSLIGTDFYHTPQTPLFRGEKADSPLERGAWGVSDEERRKVNPFDWENEFPEIMKNGGFDAVIGNPPYVRIQTMQYHELSYYERIYRSAEIGNYDLYVIFIEKGYCLLSKGGMFGMILPHKFFQAIYGRAIRQLLSEKKAIYEILDFSTNQIFKDVSTYTCLLFLEKSEHSNFCYKRFELGADTKSLFNPSTNIKITSDKLSSSPWNFNLKNESNILERMEKVGIQFSLITEKIFKGSSTGNDKIFILRKVVEKKNSMLVHSAELDEDIEIEKQILKPFLFGSDVRRYLLQFNEYYLLFPYKTEQNSVELIKTDQMQEIYPLAFRYLSSLRDLLTKRKIETTQNTFYKYSAARSLKEYMHPKIMIPDMLVENRIAIDISGDYFHGPAIHSIVFRKDVSDHNQLFFLGILNSKLFWFFVKKTSTALRGNAYRLTPQYIEKMPIRTINLLDPTDKAYHDRMVSLVDQMLELHKQLASAKTDHDKTIIHRQIDATDRQIDQLVYELYGLTEEEIKIVEECST